MLKISKILTIITLGISYGNTSDNPSHLLNNNILPNNFQPHLFNNNNILPNNFQPYLFNNNNILPNNLQLLYLLNNNNIFKNFFNNILNSNNINLLDNNLKRQNVLQLCIPKKVDKNINNDKNNTQNIENGIKTNNMIFKIIKNKHRGNQQVLISRWGEKSKNAINTLKTNVQAMVETNTQEQKLVEDFIGENSDKEKPICSDIKLYEMNEFIVQFVENNKNTIDKTLEILKITMEELKTIIKELLQKFDRIDNISYVDTYIEKVYVIKSHINSIIQANNYLKDEEKNLYPIFMYIYANTNKFITDLRRHNNYQKENYHTNPQKRDKQLKQQKLYDHIDQAKVYLYKILYPDSQVSTYSDFYNEYYNRDNNQQYFDNFSKPYSCLFQNKLHEDLIAKKSDLIKSLSEKEQEYFINKYIEMLSTYNNIKIERYDDDNKINNNNQKNNSTDTKNITINSIIDTKRMEEIDELIKECKERGWVSMFDPTRNKLTKPIIKLEEFKVIKVKKDVLEQFIKRILKRREQINRPSKYNKHKPILFVINNNNKQAISNSDMPNDSNEIDKKDGENYFGKFQKYLEIETGNDNNKEKRKEKETKTINQKRARSKNSKLNNKNKTKNTRKSKNKTYNKNKKVLEYNKINNNYNNNESLRNKIK